ncbi:MAG: ferredoxin family protein [Acidobacteriota bacterium]
MSEAETVKRGKGTVFVRTEVCKGCSFCIDFCPPRCIEFSRDFNAKGYHFPVLARPEECTGCDLCGLYCPDFAIYGIRFKDIEKRAAASAVASAAVPAQP